MNTLSELYTTNSGQQERNIAFQEFQDLAFNYVPAKEILSLLRENKTAWSKIIVGRGNEYLSYGEYSKEILEASGGEVRNVLFLIVAMDKSAVILIEKLRAKADFFELGSGLEEKLILVLQFVKK
jgi:hypothetical protein